MPRSPKKTGEKTQAERLEEFKGRFSAFLNPEQRQRRAKLHQVPPARRIAQSTLEAVDKLRTGVLMCLEAWELCQASLVDDIQRGVPIEPGKLTPHITENGKGNRVALMRAL